MYLDKPNPKAFIEYSNTMDDAYNNIDDYNSKRKRKVLIVFDDMIADIKANKKFQSMSEELFFTQTYFLVPKEVRLHNKRFTTKDSYRILLLITQQILLIKTLWIFTKIVHVNHILF